MGTRSFPAGDGALVYDPAGAGSALLAKSGSYVTIYTDAAATTIATGLTYPDGSPVVDGRLLVDATSRLPRFKDPAGRLVLYSKPDGSSIVTALYADSEEFIATANATYVPSVIITGTGIDPTGVADSTAAIQAKIDAAPAGSVITFPPGEYRLKTATVNVAAINLTKKLRLVGQGAVLKADALTAQGIRMVVANADDIEVQGLGFHCNGVQDATGVYIVDAKRVVVTGCKFTNPQSGGVHIRGGVFDLLVSNNTFVGSGYGILLNQPVTGGRHVITGNTCDGQGGDGDGIEYNSPDVEFFDVTISDNTVSGYTASTSGNAGFGIGLSWISRATVTGNVVRTCARNGIHFDGNGRDVVISNNVVSDCKHAGIEIQGENGITYRNVLIVGNTVTGCCTAPTLNLGRAGIECGTSITAATAGWGVRGLVISDNTVSGNAQRGIYTIECRKSVVSGNNVRDNVGPGIEVVTAVEGMVLGNTCTDTQTTKTQTYGLRVNGGGADSLLIANNTLGGNLTAAHQDVTTGACYMNNHGITGWDGVSVLGGARRVGFCGTAPIAKRGATPDATDLATAITLVNALKADLVAYGLKTA